MTARVHWLALRDKSLGLLTSATGVLILTTVGTLLVRMVSSVTLTRLLAPEAFGLVGIISSIFFSIALLTDLGFQAHVVRHPRGDETHFQDAIWTIHAVRGVVLGGLAMAGAPIVAWALAVPEVTWPFAAAAVTYAIEGVSSLSLMTMLRSNRSRLLSLVDLLIAAIQALVSIVLAVVLRNVWALIFAMIASSSLKFVISYAVARRPHKITFDTGLRKEFWAFSRLVMASGFVTLLIGQSDKFVLARMLSLAQFGLYTTANTLAIAPQAMANAYVMRILYPVYAQAFREEPESLGPVYYSAGRMMSWLYWLGGGLLIGGGPLIVRILYDPRYLAAGPFLSVLAIGTLLTLSNKASAGMLMALGNTRFTLIGNVIRLVWLAIAILPAYDALGVFGIILVYGAMEVPVYLYSAYVLARHHIFSLRHELVYVALALAGLAAGRLADYLAWVLLPQLR